MTANQIRKSIRSLENQIAEHEDKIANPHKYLRPDLTPDEVKYYTDGYWPKEIRNFRELIEIETRYIEEQRSEP